MIQNFDGAALGFDGARLAYDGIPNSIAIEFDIHRDPSRLIALMHEIEDGNRPQQVTNLDALGSAA